MGRRTRRAGGDRAVVFFVFLDTPDGRRNGAGWLLLIVGFFVAVAVYGSAKKALSYVTFVVAPDT